MLKNIFLLALLTLLNRFVYHIKYSRIYTYILDLSNEQGFTFLAYSFGGITVLLLLSYLFTQTGLFRIAEILGSSVLQLSQVCLLGLAILNVIFWFVLGEQIYNATQFLPLVILFSTLFGASASLNIVDFNFYLRHATMPSVVLTLASFMVVQTLALI